MNLAVIIVSGVMITIGAVCALVRAERGPSMLDRVVAVDVVVAAVLAAVALISAWTLRADLVPVLVVLALVGFIGSVTIARFAAAESDDDRRILTREEARELEAARRTAELDAAEAEHHVAGASTPRTRVVAQAKAAKARRRAWFARRSSSGDGGRS